MRDIHNRSDPFSVAVKKDVEVVGHVPRHYSCVFSLFLRNDGVISCCVNGGRRYSRDLPQGGLEIPCIYTFKTNNRDFLDKTKKRLEELEASVSTIKDVINAKVDVVCTDNEESRDLESVSTTDMDAWIKIKDIALTNFDRRLIFDGEKLTDKHINSVQTVLHEQFFNLNGLVLSFLQCRPLNGPTSNAIQILHIRGDHWIVAATGPRSKIVRVHDSAYSSLDQSSSKLITSFFRCSPSNAKITHDKCKSRKVTVNADSMQLQMPPRLHLVKIQQKSTMISHLILCLTQKKMELFLQHAS